MRNFLFLLFFVFISLACSTDDPYKTHKINLNFIEKSTFGLSESFSESSLHSVVGVRIGPESKVFVADAARFTINVYTKQGEYLYSFGQRGRGPGEFTNIRGFNLIGNSVYVWDQSLQRLSTFSLEGSHKETFSLEGVAAPIKIFPSDQSFLVFHSENKNSDPSTVLNNRLAHSYTAGFSKKEIDFLPIEEISDGIEETAVFLKVIPGSILMVNNNRFLFIPTVYNGHIYEYSKTSSWVQSKIYKGLNQETPYSVVGKEEKRKHDVSISSVYSQEPQRFILHNQSRGLLKYRNFYFHFTFTDIEDKRVFGVELYDIRLNPVGYSPIKSIPITDKPNNYLQWFVDAVDSDGNFYFRERYRDGSRIRVMQVDDNDLQKLIN